MSLDATPINYDTVAEAYNHKRGNNLSERLKLSLHKRTFRSAKQFVVWSRWVKKSLVEDYGVPAERIEVIPPGTDLRLWQLSPEELATRYHKPAGMPVRILFVGGDFKRKGGDLLVEAYRQIFSPETPTELHLVTKAELDPEPDKGIYIHRGITANSPEMQKLFRQADIFVLPTEGDCLPVVLGEAMAASLPIISTRVGAIDEVVLEGENGLLIKPKDKVGLVNALDSLVNNSELRQKMGHRGRQIAEADHDSTRNSQRLLELCKAIAV
jgi:glycosyltransferase involved in cell wall biosynthesis